MEDSIKKIISLTKRKGFVYPSSLIYGGFSSTYDFGPRGVALKKNLKQQWWKEMTRRQEDVVGLDSSIIMNPKVWQASGHLTKGFADKLSECKKCHKRFKDLDKDNECPECGGELTPPRDFNLMMKTFVGPVEEEATTAYLRAETCQGIFVNFKNVMDSMRVDLPFGIAQIGKSFRNEITPGNFIFRMREFEQMEMQWFCKKEEANDFFEFWLEQRLKWYERMGLDMSKLRKNEIGEDERAHYAQRQVDIEYKFPFGWGEIEGVHNRGDWDLSNHSKHSEEDFAIDDNYPWVIETSVGVERSLFAFLVDSFEEIKKGRDESNKSETVLRLSRKLAPTKVAVFPLLKNKDDLVEKAKEVFQDIKIDFETIYDESGSIGKRYRRQDEVGTPLCVTIDFDTLEDNSVTIRERDTMKQIRVKIKDLKGVIERFLKGDKFLSLGKEV
jgi:glycyl-tRNA synthetase